MFVWQASTTGTGATSASTLLLSTKYAYNLFALRAAYELHAIISNNRPTGQKLPAMKLSL